MFSHHPSVLLFIEYSPSTCGILSCFLPLWIFNPLLDTPTKSHKLQESSLVLDFVTGEDTVAVYGEDIVTVSEGFEGVTEEVIGESVTEAGTVGDVTEAGTVGDVTEAVDVGGDDMEEEAIEAEAAFLACSSW